MNKVILNEDGFRKLAAGIIIRAIKDYKRAQRLLTKDESDEEAIMLKADCECFFLGEWINVISGIDGKIILQRLEGG